MGAPGVCSSAAGFFALRIVEAGLDGVGIARRVYALTCFSGMLGLVMLAVASDANIGGADVLLVSGIAIKVTRTVSVIWVNRRTTSGVLATVHSFLDQAESTGGIIGGFALTLLAQVAGISIALIAFTCALVTLSHADRAMTFP